jgi:hypothetical protein
VWLSIIPDTHFILEKFHFLSLITTLVPRYYARSRSYDRELQRQRWKKLQSTRVVDIVRFENKNIFFCFEKCPNLLPTYNAAIYAFMYFVSVSCEIFVAKYAFYLHERFHSWVQVYERLAPKNSNIHLRGQSYFSAFFANFRRKKLALFMKTNAIHYQVLQEK